MSITVTTRVWEHSRQRGTMKLLLLAFAEFANKDGICWPSVTKLAGYINETERNTRLLIRRLVIEGELVVIPGGGRGHTTHYGVAIGLTERQLTLLNSDLQNTVYRNTDTRKNSAENNTETHGNSDLQNTETEINSEIPCTETVKSGAGGEALNSATGSAETPQNQNDNRNRTVSKDHGGGYNDQGTPARFFQKLAETCNIPIALASPGQKAELGKAAAALNTIGATVDQLDAFAVWWWSDSNWRTRKANKNRLKPEAPRPREVQEEWGNAVLPATNGHKPAERAPPVSTQTWKPPDDALSGAALQEAIAAARTKRRE